MSTSLLVALMLLNAAPEEPEALPGPGTPLLAPGRGAYCLSREPGPDWRVQCDEKTRVCRWTPDAELSAEGKAVGRLSRVAWCEHGKTEAGLREQGYRFERAVADAPAGWRRDARNRVMQDSFDLNRRFWVGAGFVPFAEGPGNLQAMVAMGLRSEWLDDDDEAQRMYRLALFEGEAFADLSFVEATTLRFDMSRGGTRPGLRLTSFFGEARRHDVDLSVGPWVELLGIELHRAGERLHGRLVFGALGGTLDLWHSRDLESYVRLRADVGFEQDRTRRHVDAVPTGALEADLALTHGGLHRLRALAQYERLVPLVSEVAGANRLRFKLGYEVGLFAINDQPLTAAVEGRAEYRADLPDLPAAWEYRAVAALRFSFWVPARRGSDVQTQL